MNNTLMIKIAVAAVPVAVVAYSILSKDVTLKMLNERYPEIDPKVAKDAYKSIMRMAISGKLDCSNWNEEQFNQLFLQRVAASKSV